MRTVVPSTGRNAPPRPALASQVWGCSDGPCAAPALRMTRMSLPRAGAFACLLAQLPAQLPSCHGSEHAACSGVGFVREALDSPHVGSPGPFTGSPVQRAGAQI
jgi:hypothetical protein